MPSELKRKASSALLPAGKKKDKWANMTGKLALTPSSSTDTSIDDYQSSPAELKRKASSAMLPAGKKKDKWANMTGKLALTPSSSTDASIDEDESSASELKREASSAMLQAGKKKDKWANMTGKLALTPSSSTDTSIDEFQSSVDVFVDTQEAIEISDDSVQASGGLAQDRVGGAGLAIEERGNRQVQDAASSHNGSTASNVRSKGKERQDESRNGMQGMIISLDDSNDSGDAFATSDDPYQPGPSTRQNVNHAHAKGKDRMDASRNSIQDNHISLDDSNDIGNRDAINDESYQSEPISGPQASRTKRVLPDEEDEDEDDLYIDDPYPGTPEPTARGVISVSADSNSKNPVDDRAEEVMSNGDDQDDDDDDEEDDDSSSVEDLTEQARLQGRGETARCGVIARLELINFMCHKKLQVDFGPRLNFVVGHNGSGKSAILAGITLGLGARASVTSRGNNLKAFIKEGLEAAVIEVVLTNRGEQAYRPEDYGDEIIIERTIRKRGNDSSSTWKIKSEDGKTVSTQRRELDAVNDWYNIQVDNPINVLTQDAARTFLTSSDASEMYKFFLRGTQLQQLRQDYYTVDMEQRQTVNTLARKREGLANFEIKMRESLERFQIIDAALSQQSRLEEAKNEAAWALVIERESELENHNLKLERFKARKSDLEDGLERSRNDLKNASAEVERQAELFKEKDTALEAQISAEEEMTKDIRSVRDEIRKLESEQTLLNDDYRDCKGQIKDKDDRIKMAVTGIRADGFDYQAADKKRQDLLAEVRPMMPELLDKRRRRDAMMKQVETLQSERDLAENKRDAQRQRVAGVETLIRQLQAAKANHFTAYAQNMPAFMQRVEQLRKNNVFRGPVAGPIGAMIKVKVPEWSPLLESVIGNTLSAFCVTNHADRMTIQRLKEELKCDEISILTGSDEEFDYSEGEPDEDLLTVLRVLDIPDGFVRRQLVNAASIERSVLVERRDLGDKVFRKRRRNVKVCFSRDWFRVSGGEGGNSTQTLQRYSGPPRLSTDVDAQLADAAAKLPQEEEKLQSIALDLKQINREINQSQQEVDFLRHEIKNFEQDYHAKYAEVTRLRVEMEEKQPVDVPILENEKEELEIARQKIEKDFKLKEERMEKLQKRLDELRQKRKEQRDIIDKFDVTSRKIKEETEKFAIKRLDAINAIDGYEEQLRKIEEKIDDVEGRIAILGKKRGEDELRAQRFGQRVEVTKKSEEYKREIELISKQIHLAQQSEGYDLAKVKKEMEQRVAAYHKAEEDIEDVENVAISLDKQLRLRWKKWQGFRRHMSVKARTSFSYYMQTRGYEGKLKFKHGVERLVLEVTTEPGKPLSTKFDTRSLSGGERSFSTICLLLSLWDAIGCPIRALDEFDVFMDAINRRISMKLIANAAKSAVKTQFILVTPLDISGLDLGEETRVLRLKDPERG